jgi:hypothetical protein
MAEAHARVLVSAARVWLARADQRGAGEADGRLQRREGGEEQPPGKADRPPRRRDELSALQIAGVSKARRAARSVGSGRSGMMLLQARCRALSLIQE